MATEYFDWVHETGKRLKEIFARDSYIYEAGTEDYIIRAVDEAAQQSVQSDGALPSVEEVICPICQSIVRLYDGNKVGMHTPHSNVNEPICKMVGSEITPRR